MSCLFPDAAPLRDAAVSFRHPIGGSQNDGFVQVGRITKDSPHRRNSAHFAIKYLFLLYVLLTMKLSSDQVKAEEIRH